MRRGCLVPLMLSSVFTMTLQGVESGIYDSSLLNMLASFFYQFVKFTEMHITTTTMEQENGHGNDRRRIRRKSNVNEKDDKNDNEEEVEEEGHSSKLTEHHTLSTDTAILLASTVVSLFECARHYISVFTTYSNDLDYITADFLRALSRYYLPREKCAPIAYHKNVVIQNLRHSNLTFCDLVFTCTREEETKALLKQAALRL
uniref:Forkhead box protein I1-ema n=1 Tax=Lygus hesperus TaxID=30085 RepID=A0A0A9XYD9_LYGHE